MRRIVALFSAAVCAVTAVTVLSSAGGPAAPAAGTPSCGGLAATLAGTAKRDRLVGTVGDDVIVGLGGADVVRGGGGNDVICGGSGGDRLIGGDGDDELRGGGSGISHGDGEVIYDRDELVPGSGDDRLLPGYDGANDTTTTPWDLLAFSDAPNGVVADVSTGTITGDGNDVVVGSNYAVLGSPYDDVITGSDADDWLMGGDGADQIRGGAGNDRLSDSGTIGSETADDDLLDGGPGDDGLSADEGDDELLGGDGADDITSGAGADQIDGGVGNDDIHDSLVLSADQAIDGGPGRNQVRIGEYYADPDLPRIVIDLAAGTATFPDEGVTFPFAGADGLSSYLRALTWYGTEGADKLEADPTRDRRTARLIADGRGGDDRIIGTERADVIDGGGGTDVADARDGDDACRSIEIQRSC